MKAKKTTRFLSAFLAVIMVLLMIPFSAFVALAENSDYEVPTAEHKLLSSYNALSGKDISSSDPAAIVDSLQIFNRDNLGELLQKYASYMELHRQSGSERKGSDMTSFANSAGISLSRSIGANIGLEKIFKLSASRKFNLSGDFSYSEAVETYFYEYTVSVQTGVYSFDESQLDLLKNYGFWLAEYRSAPTFYYDFDLWQYTAKGRVPGIEGDVDLNLSFVDYGKES